MPVSFLATFPLIQSAIKVSGDGGMRIQLDIPDDQMDAAVGLLGMRGQVLRVTVETEQNSTYGDAKGRPTADKGTAVAPLDVAGSRL